MINAVVLFRRLEYGYPNIAGGNGIGKRAATEHLQQQG